MAATKFGRPLLEHFTLDPSFIALNNGSFGAPPKTVLEFAQKLTNTIETNPDLFHKLNYQQQLIDVRAKLANLIGAETDEVVVVTNASLGLNTVLRNLEWHPEDVIITFSTTYGSISRTAEYLSNIPPHPQLSIIDLRFPTTHAAILKQFQERIGSIKTTGRVVAIIDSIVSNPGYLLPWEEMVAICKKANILSAIDAAHSIGQEIDINLNKSQPDFWISNCHKWLYAKRAAAVLYIPKRNQQLFLSSIPTSTNYLPPSSGKNTFVAQYEWNGTIDWVPYLSVAEALRFRESIGGERAINNYCRSLALEGGKLVAKMMNTSLLDESGEGTLNMTNVELPLRPSIPNSLEVDTAFKQKLLVERNAYIAHFFHNGRWWARLSAQVWNELGDFEKIAKILIDVCKELEQEFGNVSANL